MPLASVKIAPTLNSESTFTLNEAGVTATQLMRVKDQKWQTLGGWIVWHSTALSYTPRVILSWTDLNGSVYTAVGTDGDIVVINGNTLADIAPTTITTNEAPSLTTVAGSTLVTVNDAGTTPIAGTGISINTPVSVGGLIVQGGYNIVSVLGPDSYTINVATPAAFTVDSNLPTYATLVNSKYVNVTLADFTTILTTESVQPNYSTVSGSPTITVVGGTTTNVTPNFSTVSGSPTVTIVDASFSPASGSSINLDYPVYVGGLVLFGSYAIASIISGTSYTITAGADASSTVSAAGALPTYTTVAGFASVTVNIPNITSILNTTNNQPYYTTTSGSAVVSITSGIPTNQTPAFTTASGSPSVTITGAGSSPVVGSGLFLATQVAVGGLVLFGPYTVTTVISGTSYTITAASNATSTATAAGTVPSYAVTNASATCTVTLTAHGLAIGATVQALVPTTVGGVTIYGPYTVVTVPTANTFTITLASAATSTATASENGGLAQTIYAIGPIVGNGISLNTPVSVGGIVLYGNYDIVSEANNFVYAINAGVTAATSAASAGVTPVYATTSGVATVNVTLPGHGLTAGSQYQELISTAVGGVTILGNYTVTSVTSSSVFVITAGSVATSTATASENGGLARTLYYGAYQGAYAGIVPQAVGGLTISGGYNVRNITDANHFIILSTSSATSSASVTQNSGQSQMVYYTAINPVAGNGISLNTQISVGGLRLFGNYNIATVINSFSYTITASGNATATVAAGGAVPSYATTGGSNIVTVTLANHGYSVGDTYAALASTVVGGLTISGDYVIATAPTANTFTFLAASNATSSATASENGGLAETIFYSTYTPTYDAFVPVSVGGLVVSGNYNVVAITSSSTFIIAAATSATSTATMEAVGATVSVYSTTSGSDNVNVFLPYHGETVGSQWVERIPLTVGGVTISGNYLVSAVTDANNFTIVAPNNATSTASAPENGGLVQTVFYQSSLQPTLPNYGYGVGGYGLGGYGQGSIYTPSPQISAPFWTLDHWGETLIACPGNGPIYTWTPGLGEATLQIIATAPSVNGGIFVAMPAQILVAWGSSINGVQQPNLVQWSDELNYNNWTPTVTNQAGNATIPTGSRIVGAIQAPNQALIFTDIDVYAMNYLGGQGEIELVFGFNKIANGAGLLASRAVGVLNNQIFWLSPGQFLTLTSGGVVPIPCPVWDEIFQDLDTVNVEKIVCGTNSVFNEVAWYYPSLSGGTGDNDSYIKFNALENSWDYGKLSRTAWQDYSAAGNPLGGDTTKTLYQHEVGTTAGGQPLNWSLSTGAFMIQEGNDMSFVDWMLPDFRYGFINNASTNQNVTTVVSSYRYANDAPVDSLPLISTPQGNGELSLRIRGRAMQLSFSGIGFMRMGNVRYRFAPDGRY